jgi:hypothetical protein
MPPPLRISGDGASYIGKSLLVGLTVHAPDGTFLYTEQFLSTIVDADDAGIVARRHDNGARILLPPELQPASPGQYRLRSSEQTVEDPDYLATWSWTDPEGPASP